MMLDSFQERLAALQETAAQVRELIDRLSNIEYEPGPGPSPTNNTELGAVGAELSSEIVQLLREEEDELELLREEIADHRGGRTGSEVELQRTRLKDGVARLLRELQSDRVLFRKAQMTAKHSLATAQRLERELVLQSFSQAASGTASGDASDTTTSGATSPAVEPTRTVPGSGASKPVHYRRAEPQQPQYKNKYSHLSADDRRAVTTSSDMTEALRMMHNQMATELTKSDFAQRTLEESTAAMRQLSEAYGDLGGVVSRSVDMVGTLVRSQKSDTWYLQTTVYMLLATLAWLVFRRFLYGPLWWFVWLPARLLIGGSWGVGRAIMSSSSSLLSSQGNGRISENSAGTGLHSHTAVKGLPDQSLPTIEVGADTRDADRGGRGTVEEAAEEMDEVESLTATRPGVEIEDDNGIYDGPHERVEL